MTREIHSIDTQLGAFKLQIEELNEMIDGEIELKNTFTLTLTAPLDTVELTAPQEYYTTVDDKGQSRIEATAYKHSS